MKLVSTVFILFLFGHPSQIDGEPVKSNGNATKEEDAMGCSVTTPGGIGLVNRVRQACDVEIPDDDSGCDRFSSLGRIPTFYFVKHICQDYYPNKTFKDCIQDCKEVLRKLFCREKLEQVTNLGRASIGSLSWADTQLYIGLLEGEGRKKKIICGPGIPAKLAELKAREAVLLGYRTDCLDNLGKQCESASHDKTAQIPGSCSDGGIRFDQGGALTLQQFCVWYRFIPATVRENQKSCEDCKGNWRAACRYVSC